MYGGGIGADGKVFPGNSLILNLGIEYKLNQCWEIALDTRYEHQDISTFSGKHGYDENGLLLLCGLPSSERLSLAPSLEYHHNDRITIASGF